MRITKIAVLLPIFFLTSCTKPQAFDGQKAAVSENDVIVVNEDQSAWVSDRIICRFNQADVGKMVTIDKTIDEKPIKPYLATLKVNSKKPYKNPEASVKVVKDGKRHKLVGSFKLKKQKIEVDFYYGLVVANHGVLSHTAINDTDHQLKRLTTSVLFPATTDIGKIKKSGNTKPQVVRFSGQVGATAFKVKSKCYYQLQIPYQMH